MAHRFWNHCIGFLWRGGDCYREGVSGPDGIVSAAGRGEKGRQRLKKVYRSPRRTITVSIALAIVVMLSSCGIFSPSGAGPGTLTIEKLSNGYLIRIVAENDVGEAAAFLRPDNWLIVTIADSTLKMNELSSLRSSLVDSVEVT